MNALPLLPLHSRGHRAYFLVATLTLAASSAFAQTSGGAPAQPKGAQNATAVVEPERVSPDTEESAADKLKRAFRIVEVKANTRKNLRQAIEIYKSTIESDGVDVKAKVRSYTDLSRAYLRLGDLLKKTSARIAMYEKGRGAAKKAMALSPKNADALFWDLANMATVGQTRGIMNSLFMIGDLKKGLRKVLQLNPRHNYARETLGRIYHAVPGLFGGSDSEALDLFQTCIKRDPSFTPCKITLARFHVDNGDKDKAKVLFLEVINAKKSSVPNDFRKFNKPDAKRGLKNLGS